MKLIFLAVSLALGASSAFAALPWGSIPCGKNGGKWVCYNTASSGDATPAVVQTVTLANGTALAVAPTR